MAGYHDTRTVRGQSESERIIHGPKFTNEPSPAITSREYDFLRSVGRGFLRWVALVLAITAGVYLAVLLLLATLNSAIESKLGVTEKDADRMNRDMRTRFERMRRATP
ncbi:hypothetical protein ACXR0O_19045 [Verrucomicrobiota bacterium sgz303538]